MSYKEILTKNEAEAFALGYLMREFDDTMEILERRDPLSFKKSIDNPPIVLTDSNIEFEWGWIIFWTSKKVWERDPDYGIAGNVPLLFNKFDQTIEYFNPLFSSDFRWVTAIKEYMEKKGYPITQEILDFLEERFKPTDHQIEMGLELDEYLKKEGYFDPPARNS